MLRAQIAAALCAILALLSAAPQQKPAPAPTPPQFRSGVELVHLDVSVLDRDRRPVRGLTAADFTILEDGNARSIAAFAAIDVPDASKPANAAPWMSTVAPDVQINEAVRSPEGRLFALVLDDALIPKDPAMIATAKKIAETAIDRMNPGDQMAVVFTAGSKGAQNFTSNRAKLLKAVETFQPGFANHLLGWEGATFNQEKGVWERSSDTDTFFQSGSIRTLEGVAAALAAAPQRRKAILFVSTGVFADVGATAEVVLAGPGVSMAIRDAHNALVGRLPAMYRRLKEANITIYTLDPAGLGGMEAYVARTGAGIVAMATATRYTSPSDEWFNPSSPPRAVDLARKVAEVDLDFLKTAAANTGGLAITDTNDLAGGVNRIFDENGSYYLVGFVLTAEHRPGSMHRLQVKVNRPDVTVRTRSGYEVPEPPVDTPAKPAPSPATLALAGPVPAGTLSMRVALAPFAAPTASDKKAAAVTFVLGLEHVVKEASAQTFDVEVRAFSSDGSGKAAERRTGKVTLRRAASGDAAVDVLGHITLPPGRYELRLGASLAPAGSTGGLYADLEVPDFSREPLSLSGVLFDTTPPANAGPLDALEGIVSIVPTTRRDFTRDVQKVGTFLRIYQGGDAPIEPVWLRVSIRDETDRAVYNYPYRLTAAKFTGRAADFNFDVPLEALKPGPYVLMFEATAGKSNATRQVRFRIR